MTRRPVRRLPDGLVNKIAAGEVVERPASVVKELIENSLDAGASHVEVAVEGAGRGLVAVVDDGQGMPPEDVLLALDRHATSKLGDEAELAAIGTLGFRGEALPAIFAVSRLRLLSRAREAPRGYLVLGAGGVVGEAGDADGPVGTSVEVRDLFYNTPARAKFLKSPATEQSAIVRAVTQLVLANPAVHVRLTSGGRLVLNAPAAAGPRERLGSLYGFGLAERLLEVAGEQGVVRLTGVIGPPATARTHRDDIHFVVNGRAVRDTLLTQALVEAYRPLLPRDQFPLALLVLTVDPGEVDVNVHPTKAWVRFRHPRLLHDVVHEAARRALARLDAVTRGLQVRAAGDLAPGELTPGPAGDLAAAGTAGPLPGTQGGLFQETERAYDSGIHFGTVVGQIEDTFIVSHTPDEVFFVDQHVAHERVLFERLRAGLEQGTLPAQELLFSQPLELAPARRRIVEGSRPELERLGFVLEGFGGDAVVLRAVPSLLKAEEPHRLVDDLAREIEEEGARSSSPVLDRVLAFVACRAAIKANQPLVRDEMTRLLEDLAATATPFYCPHGRPVVSRIPLRDIRRELRRDW